MPKGSNVKSSHICEGASENPNTNEESFVGLWIILFPATYLVHIAEEFWGRFPAWATEHTGLAISDVAFVAANAFFWFLMVGAVVTVLRRRSLALIIISLATIITINATLHFATSLLTQSYSPGLVSGLLLWLPLGIWAFTHGRRALMPHKFRWGVILGVIAHILVPLTLLGFAFVTGGGWRAV